jgi:hypothetical protein
MCLSDIPSATKIQTLDKSLYAFLEIFPVLLMLTQEKTQDFSKFI